MATRIAKAWALALMMALAICATFAAGAQDQPATATSASGNKSYSIDVDATKEWVDTNIDLRAEEKLNITATGTVTYAAQAFQVGASKEYVAPVAGRLFLGVNQSMKDAANAQGSFQVKIEVESAGLSTADATNAGGPPEEAIPSISTSLLNKIPRRVSDPQGNPGDMVNILLIGTQDEVVNVFTTAGWVKVDSSVGNTVMTGLLDTFEKKDYLTMPMSTLFLFNRPQDYGFAHAEPVRVAMSRNHLRVWKSDYEVGGRPVWCIAATHDIGFERDQRNNGVTHKIDPKIDGEREYVNDTLSGTGFVVKRTHATPPNALTEAKTATGGSFESDGRVLVLVLKNGTSATN